jgi:hypothetical protein
MWNGSAIFSVDGSVEASRAARDDRFTSRLRSICCHAIHVDSSVAPSWQGSEWRSPVAMSGGVADEQSRSKGKSF